MPRFSDYIIYADESGDHGMRAVDPGYPVFVLACCLFRKNAYINRVVPGLHGFKFRHFGHDGVILHERDIRKDTGTFSILRNENRKEEFLEELTEIIRDLPMEVVAAVVRKDQYDTSRGPSPHPYHTAFRFCLARIHALLVHSSEDDGSTHVTCEGRGRVEDAQLELEFRRIRDGDNATGRRLPFEIVITDKKANSAGLQIADLIARPIGMAFVRPAQSNRAWEVVQEKLAKDPSGQNLDWAVGLFP